MKKILVVLSAFLVLQACTWVELTPEGNKVRVLGKSEVSSCKHLGSTTVSVKATLVGADRVEAKVKEELEILARNAASDLRGDTVVAVTAIKDGKQTYSVYRCVNP